MYINAIYYLYNHPILFKSSNIEMSIIRLIDCIKNLELKMYLGLVSKASLGTEFE